MKKAVIVIFGILAAIIFKLANDLDFFKTLTPVENFKGCRYLDIEIPGPEDMTRYRDDILLIGSGDYFKLWGKGTPTHEQLGIYAVYDASSANFRVRRLKINGFPPHLALYFHGITVSYRPDGDYLFAINHAYTHGGERVEMFKIINDNMSDLSLHYMHSILVDQKYNGGLNDLIVVSENRFIATMFIPIPDPIEGRSKQSAFEKLKITAIWLSKQKYSYLVDCTFKQDTQEVQAVCKDLNNTLTVMVNGMTWDYKDRVWAAEPFLKGIWEYRVTKDGLDVERFIDIGSASDNVEYDSRSDSLYVGMIPKFNNLLALQGFLEKTEKLGKDTKFDYWGAIGEFKLRENKLEVLLQGQNVTKGTSGGYRMGSNLFVGSWPDFTVKVCSSI